jgi:hypothetical protein
MSALLRLLGAGLLIGGLALAAVGAWMVVGDDGFAQAAAAYGRHPDHPIFQTEYRVAAVRHYALAAAAAVALVGGLGLGGLLLGVGELLRRVPRR